MPYHISGKGDAIGCKDQYAVVNSDTGKVMGCHPTRANAEEQLAALHINVTDTKDAGSSVAPANPSFTVDPKYPGVGIKRPQGGRATGGNIKSKYGKKPKTNRRGRSGDATGSDGAISSGGPGGSMG
jgi:hypothetical protein